MQGVRVQVEPLEGLEITAAFVYFLKRGLFAFVPTRGNLSPI